MRALLPLVACVCLTACGDSSSTPRNETGGSGGASGSAGIGGKAGAAGGCQPAPGEPSGLPERCVQEVRGGVFAAPSAPLGDLPVTLCGVACFAGKSGADGRYAVEVGAFLPEGGYVVFAHGRPGHASAFVRLPSAPPEVADVGDVELPPLASSGVFLPPDSGAGGPVTVGRLTLQVEPGTVWELDLEDTLLEKAGRELRATEVQAERAPEFAKGSLAVMALGPFQATPSKPVGVVFELASPLPPGTQVELLVMDDGILSNANTGGKPRVDAVGKVSSDGKRVQTNTGEGLRVLTWLALRTKP